MSSTQQLLLGEGAGGGPANYIEDVFSTYLYTGNGSTQTITNDIDLSTKGGLVWIKYRNGTFGNGHYLYDTVRGAGKALQSNLTDAETAVDSRFTSFNSNGFSLATTGGSALNASTYPYVSWTFREQPKFFDIVTWSGDATGARTFSHSLASEPACIIMRSVTSGSNWITFHRGMVSPNATWWQNYMVLDDTQAANNAGTAGLSSAPTSTTFSVASGYNTSGQTYIAYLFAHDAGGFGLTGTDNVISCGSYTGTGTDQSISLGFEPQWVMIKKSSGISDWAMFDNMRGATVLGVVDSFLKANGSNAEYNAEDWVEFYAEGFKVDSAQSSINGNGDTMIYIAIRRGPMKVPTSGTSVFGINARTGTGVVETVTGSAGVSDAVLIKNRGSAVASLFASRLTNTNYLVTSSTAAQVAAGTTILQANPWDVMDGVKVGTTSTITNASGNTFINYLFKRAPSFFDEVCYTGAGSPYSPVAHNLTVVPQMIIGRFRDDVGQWYVYHEALGATGTILFNSNPVTVTAPWTLTNTTFQYDTLQINTLTYVTYLFATCAGVSKVGSYTGNGSTQTIDCGFGAGGARFVLIKRTDASGDWYVYDTARGMTVLTDPYYLINSTAAEVATLGSVTTVATGFAVDNSILAGINVASPAAYIFLAIA